MISHTRRPLPRPLGVLTACLIAVAGCSPEGTGTISPGKAAMGPTGTSGESAEPVAKKGARPTGPEPVSPKAPNAARRKG